MFCKSVVLGSTIQDTATLTGDRAQAGYGRRRTGYPDNQPDDAGDATGGTVARELFAPDNCAHARGRHPASRTVNGDGTYSVDLRDASSAPVGSTPSSRSTAARTEHQRSRAVTCPAPGANEKVTVAAQSAARSQQSWLPNNQRPHYERCRRRPIRHVTAPDFGLLQV